MNTLIDLLNSGLYKDMPITVIESAGDSVRVVVDKLGSDYCDCLENEPDEPIFAEEN